jgi:hypothetical protein
MNKNPIIEKKLSVLINGVRKEIETSLNFEVSFCEYFKGLSGREKIAHFKRFRAEALIKPFTLKTDGGETVRVLWKDMTKKQKSAVKTRLWRLGQLIDVKLGKTPVSRKPRQTPSTPAVPPPPQEYNGNGGNESMAGIGSKAPKERELAWRLMAQVIKEKTGWKFSRFMKEVGPLLKEVLG